MIPHALLPLLRLLVHSQQPLVLALAFHAAAAAAAASFDSGGRPPFSAHPGGRRRRSPPARKGETDQQALVLGLHFRPAVLHLVQERLARKPRGFFDGFRLYRAPRACKCLRAASRGDQPGLGDGQRRPAVSVRTLPSACNDRLRNSMVLRASSSASCNSSA